MEMVLNGKAVKVTAKDIQENIRRIHDEMKNTPVGTEKYTCLQEEMEKEYTILKKFKDSRFYIAPKDAIIIGCISGVAIFMIALERENPKALKLASFLLKLFPLHL